MSSRPGDVEELALRDFHPRPMLRRPANVPDRPAFPAIDAHSHLASEFAGEWQDRGAADLATALEECRMAGIVDLDGGQGEHLRAELERWEPISDRVAVFAGLDYASWASDADFGEHEARHLREGVALGAAGLKVWKILGLRARDAHGQLIAVDDPRLDPVWAAAGELGVPVTIHVADPIAFFEPLDRFNERWEELHVNPDWHFWPPRHGSRPSHDGFPPFDELIDSLEAVVVRHPQTRFIGAHVGCAAEDLDRVSTILERCPNFHVDIAARLGELGRQPYTARAFFLRWSDRILFGTDAPPDLAFLRVHWRFLETWDESFDYGTEQPPEQGRWQIHGIGLPEDVLRKVYADNARRLLRFGS